MGFNSSDSTTYYTTFSFNTINNTQYYKHGKQAIPSYYFLEKT